MALGLSPAQGNAILNSLCRAAAYTPPAAVYIQLHTADPGAAGGTATVAEPRKQITFGSAAAGGQISNTAAVTWSPTTTAGDASHYSLWDAVSAGNFLASGIINANAYLSGDTYNMAIGAIVLSFGIAA